LRDLARRALRLAAFGGSLLIAFSACGRVNDSHPDATAGSASDSNTGSAGDSGATASGVEAGGRAAGDGGATSSGLAGAPDDPSGGQASGESSTGPLSKQAALCESFLDVWMQRQAEREPGQPIPPPAQKSPCFECLRGQDTICAYPNNACAAISACIDRHCLCTTEQPVALTCSVSSYPSDLCSCIQSCTPADNSRCESAWESYMRCAVAACGEACGQ